MIDAHREVLGGRSVTVVGGDVSTIPGRPGECPDEVAYERGDPAGSVPVETPKETTK